MTRLVKKGLLLITIVLIIFQLINLCLPYYWGNDYATQKLTFLKGQSDKNVFFMGSSRTHSQISPKIFDTSASIACKSYNLGFPGTMNPDNYYLTEKFIKNNRTNALKYLFIDIIRMGVIADRNLHTTQTNYSLNLKQLLFYIEDYKSKKNYHKQAAQPSKDAENKIKQLNKNFKNYLISFRDHIFVAGYRDDFIKLASSDKKDRCYLGKNNDGFCPYDYEIQMFPSQKEYLSKRKKRFELGGMVKLQKPYEKYKMATALEFTKNAEKEHSALIDRINEIKDISLENNFYPIFITVPPGGFERIAILNSIDQRHTINLLDPYRFPEFFDPENYFDEGHMNQKGATIITKKLAGAFNNLVEENKDYITALAQ